MEAVRHDISMVVDMTVWVLFVWIGTGLPAAYSYQTKAECEEAKSIYARAACVKVEVRS